MTAASRVKKIQVSGREIICIDYSQCKADKLIYVFNLAKEIVVNSGKECLLLNNLDRTYITPPFLRHVEREMYPLRHLVKKNAFINLTIPQRMILKAFALFMNTKDYLAFDTYDEAIRYLISDEDEK
ncbi:MAG: hypothetical protein JST69_01300 [Bacteroidetes bacterium]|nr:hypothetical protein [Bacteroidota bacterium]